LKSAPSTFDHRQQCVRRVEEQARQRRSHRQSGLVGPITIHDGALTGNCCVLSRDVVVGADAQVMDLTALSPGTVVGAAEIWDGSPAKKTGMVNV
jgi:carbonic anhydrase/acetyltransferase-like protein (isoleucine patch superfamily)